MFYIADTSIVNICTFSGRKYALLKLKILLSTILRNYKMVSDVTEDQFQLQGDIILKRHDGFRVQIEPRKRVPSGADLRV